MRERTVIGPTDKLSKFGKESIKIIKRMNELLSSYVQKEKRTDRNNGPTIKLYKLSIESIEMIKNLPKLLSPFERG